MAHHRQGQPASPVRPARTDAGRHSDDATRRATCSRLGRPARRVSRRILDHVRRTEKSAKLYPMRLIVELERETDGRWIAEVVDLPGVMVYGTTREQALATAQALALRVVADKLEHGEVPPEPVDVSFAVAAA
jgi:predicted RNase H-like HicB family nuclease